jgi:hypothetical protein
VSGFAAAAVDADLGGAFLAGVVFCLPAAVEVSDVPAFGLSDFGAAFFGAVLFGSAVFGSTAFGLALLDLGADFTGAFAAAGASELGSGVWGSATWDSGASGAFLVRLPPKIRDFFLFSLLSTIAGALLVPEAKWPRHPVG